MARGVPGFVRIGAALAGCALVAACTPDPAPPATPTPAPPPTVSATPSATPTETDIERQQRMDFEAAEKVYRRNLAEQQRQAKLGTAEITPTLRQTSQGEYRDFAVKGLEEVQEAGWRAVGSLEVVGVSRGGWQESKLHLISCEDGSKIRFVNEAGNDVTPPGLKRQFVQDLTVVRVGPGWILSDIRSKQVDSFGGASCAS